MTTTSVSVDSLKTAVLMTFSITQHTFRKTLFRQSIMNRTALLESSP